MKEYMIDFPDRTTTQELMEQVIAAHGGMKVRSDRGGARFMVVEAEQEAIDSFKAMYPSWGIREAPYAEISPPNPHLERLRNQLK